MELPRKLIDRMKVEVEKSSANELRFRARSQYKRRKVHDAVKKYIKDRKIIKYKDIDRIAKKYGF